jgi:hypothetical protein
MELVLEAIKQDGRSRQSASKELRRDRDVVMQTINQTWLGACVSFLGTKVRQEVVTGAVKETGRALAYASEDLTGDRDVVLEAVK